MCGKEEKTCAKKGEEEKSLFDRSWLKAKAPKDEAEEKEGEGKPK